MNDISTPVPPAPDFPGLAPPQPAKVSAAPEAASPGPDVSLAAPGAVPDTEAYAQVGGGGRLEAAGVSAWFGSHKVLERVSLSMPPGIVTALIGPSGCGKSTFLRILNRMHETTPSAQLAGEVFLDGRDIYTPGTRVTETRNRIGMVFQKPNPFPAMSRSSRFSRVHVHVGLGLGAAARLPQARTRAAGPRVSAETSGAIAYGVSDVWAGRA